MELWRAIACLAEAPTAAHGRVAAAAGLPAVPTIDEHTDVIVFQAYPYASVYLGPEGMMGGEARGRIAGFWHALGADPGAEPDHLAALLGGLASLGDAEAAATAPGLADRIRAARHALFWEHVASWMPPYLALVRRVGGAFHAAWAALAEAAVAAEAGALGAPAAISAHLRAAPPLDADADADAGLDGLIAAVLAPARAGFTIARDDLLRAADDLGIGCRVGERRYALRSLLAQDAPGVLAWLADEARRQAAAVERAPLAPVSAWWAARARATADRLVGWSALAA